MGAPDKDLSTCVHRVDGVEGNSAITNSESPFDPGPGACIDFRDVGVSSWIDNPRIPVLVQYTYLCLGGRYVLSPKRERCWRALSGCKTIVNNIATSGSGCGLIGKGAIRS